jgi:hypothetical protein
VIPVRQQVLFANRLAAADSLCEHQLRTMNAAMTASNDQLRARLMEVLAACPVEHCNPADCPLHALRKMKYSERLRWFNSLSRADLEYLAAYHYVCESIKHGQAK